MTQNDPNPNGLLAPASRRLAIASALAASMLGAPAGSSPAAAEDWQVTTQYFDTGHGGFGGWTRSYRRIGPANYGIHDLKEGSAPGNRCSVPAFEVLNPAPGEARCVGAVYAWR